jgi:hypothetical protein
MARTISATVGLNAPNRHDDVVTIQEMLNNISPAQGGPTPLLVVDGLCGKKTKAAIHKFQLQHFGWPGADSRIEPGKQTLAKLNELQPVAPVPPVPPPPAPQHTHFVFRQPGRAGTTMKEEVDFFMEVTAGVNDDSSQPDTFKIVEVGLFWLGPPNGHRMITAKPEFRSGGGVPVTFHRMARPGVKLLDLDCPATYITRGTNTGGVTSQLILFMTVTAPGQRTGPTLRMLRHLMDPRPNSSGVSQVRAGQFQFVRKL